MDGKVIYEDGHMSVMVTEGGVLIQSLHRGAQIVVSGENTLGLNVELGEKTRVNSTEGNILVLPPYTDAELEENLRQALVRGIKFRF